MTGQTRRSSHRGPGPLAAGTTAARCLHHYPTHILIMTTEPIDCYAILGLPRDATQAQISAAHRTLLRRYIATTRTPQTAHATTSTMRRSSTSSPRTRPSTPPPVASTTTSRPPREPHPPADQHVRSAGHGRPAAELVP